MLLLFVLIPPQQPSRELFFALLWLFEEIERKTIERRVDEERERRDEGENKLKILIIYYFFSRIPYPFVDSE